MTPERLAEIRKGWKKVNDPIEGGTVDAHEFAAHHFDELLAEIEKNELLLNERFLLLKFLESKGLLFDAHAFIKDAKKQSEPG